VEPVISERIWWEQWGTHRGEHEGEGPAARIGEGAKYSLSYRTRYGHCGRRFERRNDRFRLTEFKFRGKTMGSPKTINVFEETPVKR
jgi:hypothetical protein